MDCGIGEMALGAIIMLPAHGEALTEAESIKSEFNLLANAGINMNASY